VERGGSVDVADQRAGPGRDRPASALATSDAVKLFEQRAQLVRPSFRVTDDNAAEVALLAAGRLQATADRHQAAAALFRRAVAHERPGLRGAEAAAGRHLADRGRRLAGGTGASRRAPARQPA
jgi:predicted ATPase